MKDLTLSSKILLAFTIPLGLIYYFLVIPQVRATSQALSDVDSLRQSTSAEASAKQREEFKQKLAEMQTDAAKLMPATDEQYDLSVQVEALAKSKNLTINGLNVNAAQPTGLPKTTTSDVPTSQADQTIRAADVASTSALKVTVTVSVTGGYNDIEHFVAGLPALDRFVQIDQISVSIASATQLTAQVTAFAYYLPATQ